MYCQSKTFPYICIANQRRRANSITPAIFFMQFQISLPKWNIQELTGYQPITTFWQDFSIADRFGIDAIKSTFSRAFNEWKGNYKYLTELVLVLNHKIWQHNKSRDDIALLYNELWEQARDFADETLTGDEAAYYFDVTD